MPQPTASATAGHYVCFYCPGRWFAGIEQVTAHDRAAHPPCARCGGKFANLAHHQQDAAHCYCAACHRFFAAVPDHLAHLRKKAGHQYHHHHHPDSPGREHEHEHVVCAGCARRYPDPKALDTHCCRCDRVFWTRSELELHRRHYSEGLGCYPVLPNYIVEEKEEEEEDYLAVCSYCDGLFRNDEELRRHMGAEHGIVPCPASAHCQMTFVVPKDLRRHFNEGRCISGMTLAEIHQQTVCSYPAQWEVASMGPAEWAASLFEYLPPRSYGSLFI